MRAAVLFAVLGVVLALAPLVVAQPTPSGTRSASSGAMCDLVTRAFENGTEADLLTTLSVERTAGRYRVGDPAGPDGLKPETSPEFHPRDQDWQVARVDIDGDGVDDLRFTTTVGSALCERSYFFRTTPGVRHDLLTGPPWEGFRTEGSMCREVLDVVSSGGSLWLVVRRWGFRSPAVEAVTVDELHGLTARVACSLERMPGPLRVVNACPNALCRALAGEIKRGQWAPGMDWETRVVGSEKPARREQIDQIGDPALRADTDIDWSVIDVDNDGREELVGKVKFPRGVAWWILGKAGATYQRVDPRTRWRDWALTEMDYMLPSEDFVFRRSDGKNYLVLVRDHRAPRYVGRGRVLNVFLLEGGAVRRVGMVEGVAAWQVSRKPVRSD